MNGIVGWVLKVVKSKSRLAAAALVVLSALQAKGFIHLPADVVQILTGVGIFGLRDAMDKPKA